MKNDNTGAEFNDDLSSVKIEEILRKMTISEKADYLSGKNFWETMDFPAYGLPSMEVADGPYGLRKQEGISDHMGWNKSRPAVAYVSGPGMAATWDRDLVKEAGHHLGIEAKANGISILLGPAVNIVRTPLCGRCFEYYSEDPFLAADIATAYIQGVQGEGIGCCIKHYAANNQETDREFIDAEIDERTLREIYLAAFEKPIKIAQPWAVMTALNKVNGSYCSENKYLLEDVLRNDWGFKGFTMSDWSGINNRVRAIKAGLDLEMPCSHGVSHERIMAAVASGELTEEDLDKCCRRIMRQVFRAQAQADPQAKWNEPKHHDFVRKLCENSMILLQNEDHILPLDSKQNIAVFGEFASEPRFQMDGSALVNPTRRDIPIDEIKKLAFGRVDYMPATSDSLDDPEQLEKIINFAGRADVALVMVGLPKGIEAEGHDRKDLKIPAYMNKLVTTVAAVQPNTVVILSNGSPVEMPWQKNVKAIVECFLGGQAMGSALAKLLYGAVNPSGKLPVTFPKALANTPAYFNYPGQGGKVTYKEGVFIGYRYYDTKEIEPLFPFGHGLSYTEFTYSNLSLSMEEISDYDVVTVTLTVTNSGERYGSETVQIYVENPCGEVLRPIKELREFTKVSLAPGQNKTVRFELSARSFSYYDKDLNRFYSPAGEYQILAAASSQDIRLKAPIRFKPTFVKKKEITGWSTIGQLRSSEAGREMFEKIKRFLISTGKEQLLTLPIFDESETNRVRVNDLPLRILTLLSENVLNNDILDRLIAECNQKLH